MFYCYNFLILYIFEAYFSNFNFFFKFHLTLILNHLCILYKAYFFFYFISISKLNIFSNLGFSIYEFDLLSLSFFSPLSLFSSILKSKYLIYSFILKIGFKFVFCIICINCTEFILIYLKLR